MVSLVPRSGGRDSRKSEVSALEGLCRCEHSKVDSMCPLCLDRVTKPPKPEPTPHRAFAGHAPHRAWEWPGVGGGGSWRTFAWLSQSRRLRVRYGERADIHVAFLSLRCALICWQSLRKKWRTT
jgi:hypothetical protein